MPRKPDPIFAAIASHRAAHDIFAAEAAYLWPKRGRSKCAAEYKAATEAYQAATETLTQAEVRTLAGARAFAAYLAGLRCCGGSDIAPCVYSVEVWDLSAGMDRIAECLARHAEPRSRRVVTLKEAAPSVTAH